MTFQEKIYNSIALIRKAERLALAMQPDNGFYVGFSGGKDSQVLLSLVQSAGVKYRAFYNVTTNDPPPSVYYIREHYPDVEFSFPKRNFFTIVAHKGLPTRQHRFCCDELKEPFGAGWVVLTGVRRDESKTREAYNDVQVYSKRKEHQDRTRKRTIEEIESNEHRCIKGKDKLMVRPLLDWTDEDVWRYIHENGLPINPVYRRFNRLGCMFCPFSAKRDMSYWSEKYPKFKQQLCRHLQLYLDKNETQRAIFTDAEDCFNWWIEKQSVEKYLADKRQIKMTFEQ